MTVANHCVNCRDLIEERTYGSKNWEPDWDPSDDPVCWRHPNGYAACGSLSTYAVPMLPANPQYIYVASSWRNPWQEGVVKTLEAAGMPCYDFKNPKLPTSNRKMSPFRWADITMDRDFNGGVSVDAYLAGMKNSLARDGLRSDYSAMRQADTMVLVLPCNRSAHLELGWAVGMGKRTAILLEDPMEPELMYGLVDYLAPSLHDLLGWLGVED
jgi:hypothetical protein